MHVDDAWVEAELERQLQEMGPVSDGESEADDEDIPRLVPDFEQGHAAPEPVDGEQLPLDMLPSSFKELMQSMQEWETFVVADIEKEVKELQEVAEDAVSQLHKPSAPLVMDDLDDEEKAAVESSIMNLKYEKTWWRWSLHLVQQSGALDDMEEPVDGARDVSVAGDSISQQSLPQYANGDEAFASPPRVASVAIDEEKIKEQRRIEEERRRFEEEQRRAEDEQKRVEAERINALIALERERVARMTRMAEEEQQRRQEEERHREEFAMHSEEIRLHEYYEYERSCRRREWRCFYAEDRRSSQLRDEERKAKEFEEERILRKERERKVDESRAMAKEDRFAARWREADRESHERNRMASEEISSEVLREQSRRERELRQLAHADVESQSFRELSKAMWERDRMAIEDGCSSFLRNTVSASSVVKKKQVELAQGSSIVDIPLASDKPSVILAGLFVPPAPEKCSLESSSAANVAKSTTTRQHHRRDIDEENDNFLANPIACETVIDPWSGNDPIPSSRASKADASRTSAHCAVDEPCLCTSALCEALKDGMEGWRNAGLAWRRPPARQEWQIKSDKRQLVKSSSASSTPRGAGLLESHDFDLHESGFDDASIEELVKFELREERLEQIPRWLPRAVELRILNLTGNRLRNLDPISECVMLEELLLCQNALTSLKGLKRLDRLVVLRATANKIVDASDIGDLQCLRVLALSMNQLEAVQWRTSCVARLELYGNALASTSFLEFLPSLTYLDLGRNQFTSVDPRISSWNPFLIKLYLYENRIASLSPLMLPLLTDLVLNKNCLTTLGPLGFLPSLERLQAKENKIASLTSPIAASPLLQTLALTDNMLDSTSVLQAVFEHPRLQQLHLNENPIVADLMERFRPWVLRNAPDLLELDNEPVTDKERMPAIQSRAVNDPYFPYKFGDVLSDAQASPRKAGDTQKQTKTPQDLGLLGLTKILDQYKEEDEDHHVCASSPSLPSGSSQQIGCAFKPKELLHAGYDYAAARWIGAFKKDIGTLGGCTSCSLALWCECLLGARSAPMSAHLRDERLLKTNRSNSKSTFLMFLRRRTEFWISFLDLCCNHYEKLLRAQGNYSHVCRSGAFEIRGSEHSTRRMWCRIQARWRGIMARRNFARMQFRRRCQNMPDDKLKYLPLVQALWRGVLARRLLRANGIRVPIDKRKEKRAAQEQMAAVRIQALARAKQGRRALKEKREEVKRAQQKLNWAREMSKVHEEDDEMAEIDLGQLLQDLDVKALGDKNAFAVRVPEPVVLKKSSRSRPSTPLAGGRNISPDEIGQPTTAWGTPPTTATANADTRTQQDKRNRCIPLDLSSSAGSPSSEISGRRPQRTRSLSSTAESAVTENDGFRAVSRSQPNLDDCSLEESRAAKAFYDARQRRERPPGLPKVTTPSMGGRGGVSRGGSLLGRASGSGRGGRRVGQDSHSVGKDKPVLKAQDQLAAYFKAQQQETHSQGRASPDSDTMEFSTGPLNHKLLRSAMQSPPHSNSSPRARSPKRLST